MTVIVDFTPNKQQKFQFQAVLDGVQHTLVVSWNIAAERYYISAYTTQGALVVSSPMVGSPSGYDIPVFGDAFTSSVVFREGSSQFEISDAKAQNQSLSAMSDYLLDSQMQPFILGVSVLA